MAWDSPVALAKVSRHEDQRPREGGNGPSEGQGIRIGRPRLGIEFRQKIA